MSGLKKVLKKNLSQSSIKSYRFIRTCLNRFIWHGEKVECNICGSHLKRWKLYGDKSKKNPVCPVCNSFGRHRFLWYCIQNNIINIESDHKILHIAPELSIRNLLEKKIEEKNYITADLYEDDVTIKLDITKTLLPDCAYDWIICSHVMEHVNDDDKALSECYRILKPGGKLIVQVPLGNNSITIEDSNIKEPCLREKVYGQSDHVRLYGQDINDRIISNGFDVTVLDPKTQFENKIFERFAFDLPEISTSKYESESKIFLCGKI